MSAKWKETNQIIWRRGFYERGCQERVFSCDWMRWFFSRLPAPVILPRKFVTELRSASAGPRRRWLSLPSSAAGVLARDVPTTVLSEARGLWLYGVVRGGIAWDRRLFLDPPGDQSNPLLDTLPRRRPGFVGPPNLAQGKRMATAAGPCRFWARASSPPALGRCRFHTLDVVATSFLPKTQSQGGQLASDGEPHQGRFPTEGYSLLIKLSPRTGALHGCAGG